MRNPAGKRNALQKRLAQCADVVRGSVNAVCARCNRAHCICQKKTARRAYRLTYKDRNQRTRIVYVPQSRLPTIRKMIANYARLRNIIEELVETNIEVFKKAARP